MKKLIDRIIESIYLKRFPDRVHDHELAEIARQPLPIIKEERYKPITLIVLETIPEDIPFNEDEIRDLLSRKLASKIAEIIKIERDDPPFYHQTKLIGYRGEIKVLKEEV